MALCSAVRAQDGKPCLGRATHPDGRCFFHTSNPEVAAGRAEWRVRDKVLRTPPPPPTTLDEAIAFASWAMWAHASGRLPEQRLKNIQVMLETFRDLVKSRDQAGAIAVLKRAQAEKAGK